MAGATLLIEDGSIDPGLAQGGTGAHYPPDYATPSNTDGQGAGDGIFVQGDQTITLAPGTRRTLTLRGVIADQLGLGGSGALSVSGAGRVVLAPQTASGVAVANRFAGGVTISTGAKPELGSAQAAGTGAIAFQSGRLVIDGTAMPGNHLGGVRVG